MTREELKQRFEELEAINIHDECMPPPMARRQARVNLLKELRKIGMKNFEAVFEVHKVERTMERV